MKTQVIIFPRGSLTSLDKTALRRAGYCAVEADDPAKVVLALPGGAVNGDMLTLCALNAMAGQNSGTERARFTEQLTARLNAIEASKVNNASQQRAD
jgi:hypothetical protein